MRFAHRLRVSRIVQGPFYLRPASFVGRTATVQLSPATDSQLDHRPSGEHLRTDRAEEGAAGQFLGADHAAAAQVPLVLSGPGCQSANTEDRAVIKGLIRGIYQTFMDRRNKPVRLYRGRVMITVVSWNIDWRLQAVEELLAMDADVALL